MASILLKAKQQQQKPKKKTTTNLNDLNKQDIVEEKVSVQAQAPSQKQEDDWGVENQEAIDLTHLKLEKKEEEAQAKQAVHQQKVENVTWGATKEMDDQEAMKIAASLAQSQTEQEDQNKGKKIMKSWVPALREDGPHATSTFEEEKEYFPEIGDDILTKKVEKPKPVPTLISRADESNSSSNPPRFNNTSKGGFKPLELTEQQKKLLEIQDQNKKEYKVPTGDGFNRPAEGTFPTTGGLSKPQEQAPSTNTIGRSTEGSEIFGSSSAAQPPRFSSKKATEGGNFLPIQKTDLDLKQEELAKRTEERLKEIKSNPETNLTSDNSQFEMRRANIVEKKQPEEQAASDVSKPPPRFVNAKKDKTGPNFKPIEVKEEKKLEIFENKKYTTGKKDVQVEDSKEQKQEAEKEIDNEGFQIVKA